MEKETKDNSTQFKFWIFKQFKIMVRGHGLVVVDLNPGTVYWMVVSDASYYN